MSVREPGFPHSITVLSWASWVRGIWGYSRRVVLDVVGSGAFGVFKEEDLGVVGSRAFWVFKEGDLGVLG